MLKLGHRIHVGRDKIDAFTLEVRDCRGVGGAQKWAEVTPRSSRRGPRQARRPV